MKILPRFKVIGLLSLVSVLASCGYRLNEVLEGTDYNNEIYTENYYEKMPASIDQNSKEYSVSSETFINLNDDEEKYKVCKTIDEVSTFLDSEIKTDSNPNGTLSAGIYGNDNNPNDLYKTSNYGANRKMSNIDPCFTYGTISKLFDGQMYCHGGFELVRIQASEKGFGYLFSKQVTNYTSNPYYKPYFMVNFKSAAMNNATKGERSGICNNERPINNTDITLYISFYLKDGNKFNKVTASYDFYDFKTANGENQSVYTMFAFSFEHINILNCAGFSLSYKLNYTDIDYQTAEGGPYYHSLLFYEVMFNGTEWR